MIKNKIIIASSKGGVGKSTISCGLARALANQGNKVLLVDCDFSNRCLDLMLAKEDEIIYNLYDVVEERIAYKNAIINIDKYYGVSLIPGPSAKADIDLEKVSKTLIDISNDADYDYMICDTASGLAVSSALSKEFADTALVVSTQQPTSIRAAENLALIFDKSHVKNVRMVISAFDTKTAAKRDRLGILDIINRSKIQTIGVVPYDKQLVVASDKGELAPEKSLPFLAFKNIANRVEGDNVPLFYGMKKINRQKAL